MTSFSWFPGARQPTGMSDCLRKHGRNIVRRDGQVYIYPSAGNPQIFWDKARQSRNSNRLLRAP